MTEAVVGLLSGPVGAGKTTAAERVAGLALRRGLRCGGLLAPAMHNTCGQKVAIWGVDLAGGERRVLARTDRDLGGPAIGPYSFDAAALAWATATVEAAVGQCELLVVDEIGKLELWQGLGLAAVLPRLASGEAPRALVVVRDWLLGELQDRLGEVTQRVYMMTAENREGLASRVFEDLMRNSEEV